MKPIRIFRHVAHEGPGYLETILQQCKLPYEIIRIDANDAVPPQVDDISAAVFMGGPMSVNDPLPWIAEELNVIRNAAQMNIPILGHCLGGQLISKALGGEITANPYTEIGWHNIEKIAGPATEQWLGELPESFLAFHWHGETFSIPAGASRILGNKHCANQAFVKSNILALQCHVEMTAELVQQWVELHDEELQTVSPAVQNAETILEDLEEKIHQQQQAANVLYRRWLENITAT